MSGVGQALAYSVAPTSRLHAAQHSLQTRGVSFSWHSWKAVRRDAAAMTRLSTGHSSPLFPSLFTSNFDAPQLSNFSIVQRSPKPPTAYSLSLACAIDPSSLRRHGRPSVGRLPSRRAGVAGSSGLRGHHHVRRRPGLPRAGYCVGETATPLVADHAPSCRNIAFPAPPRPPRSGRSRPRLPRRVPG